MRYIDLISMKNFLQSKKYIIIQFSFIVGNGQIWGGYRMLIYIQLHKSMHSHIMNQCFGFCVRRLLENYSMSHRVKRLISRQKFSPREQARLKNVFGLMCLKHELVETHGLQQQEAAKQIIKELNLQIFEVSEFSSTMIGAIKNELKVYKAFLFCSAKEKIQVKDLIHKLCGSADTFRSCLSENYYLRKLSHFQQIIREERSKLQKTIAASETVIHQQQQQIFKD